MLISSIMAASCADDEYDVQLAVIETDGNQFMVEVPSSVGTGDPFNVVLITYGGACTSLDSTEVTLEADSAAIAPYNRQRITGACPLNIELIPHSAQLVFDTPGAKEIVINGRKGAAGELTDVRHTVSVVVE